MDITPASKTIVQNNVQAPHVYKTLLEGIHFKFPTFKHDHPAIINVDKVAYEGQTVGQRVADGVAATMGSWRLIIIQSSILAAWLVLNSVAWINHWDNYPFILLNLALSFEAAYAAPIIMMSQNRQADRDRLDSRNDYEVNMKAELEILQLHEKFNELRDSYVAELVRMQQRQLEMLERLEAAVCSRG